MPAARHISRSPCIALAVIATMRGRSSGDHFARDPPRGFEPVHLRHLHVHQHDVVGLPLDRLDGLDAVRREVGAVAHLLQDAQRELLVDDVVLGQQDAQRMARRHRRDRAAACAGAAAALGASSCASSPTSVSKSCDWRIGLPR